MASSIPATALRDGIGAMSDDRVASFFDKMVRAGVVAPRHRLSQGVHASLRQQGRWPRSAAKELGYAMAGPAALSETDPGSGVAVSLRAVTKVYDSGVVALGPLDLEVRNGEFVSLLGPSGCGKSTALRLIAGLNAPTSGTVGVSYRPAQARAGHSIGFVFQEPTLMPWTSVRENVRLPLKLADARPAESEARVVEAHWRRSGWPNSPTLSRANCPAA